MAGRYKAYPEYKDSDEEWLSTMPIHWEWSKVSWSFRAEKGKNGQLLTKEYCGRKKGEFPVYSGQTENGGVMGTIDTYEFDSGVTGVLFSTTVGAKAMHLTHLKGKFSLSQNCMIIMPMVSLDVRYCFYHFQPLFAHERSLIPDHMQASFRMEDLYQYKIILPPVPEQKQIAKFLDHETGKIDALIEKQQALIALLKEKRLAVISHAVTKGLNPHATMKDSGAEWLGDVPEHWGRSYLGFECSVKARLGWKGLKAEEYVDEGYVFLATPNIKGEAIDFTNVDRITQERYDESPEIMLNEGDVLVTKDGSTTGTTNVVKELPEPATVNSSIAVLRSFGQLDSLYLYYFFTSDFTQNVITRMRGGMGVPHLFQADLKKFDVLVPPLIEQRKIAKHVEFEASVIDVLLRKAESAIELMQERRAALISAAVTGKIDVRDWEPAPEAQGNVKGEDDEE